MTSIKLKKVSSYESSDKTITANIYDNAGKYVLVAEKNGVQSVELFLYYSDVNREFRNIENGVFRWND